MCCLQSYHIAKHAQESDLQMEGAFAAGYDPALEIGKLRHNHLHHHHKHHSQTPAPSPSVGPGDDDAEAEEEEEEPVPTHIKRHEQARVNRIVSGEEVGSYWLMIGSKVC